MRNVVSSLLLFTLIGCAHSQRTGEIATAASQALSCPAEKVRVEERSSAWVGVGCGREAYCDTVNNLWQCVDQVPAIRAALLVVAGCKADTLKLSAPLSQGSQTQYRVLACDRAFLCTAKASETSCAEAPALNQDENKYTEIGPSAAGESSASASESGGPQPSQGWWTNCPAKDGESARARALRCKAEQKNN